MAHQSIFVTPISMSQLSGMDEMNREITDLMVAESASTPGVLRSNVGGWHSPPNLAGRPEACLRTLMNAIVTRARETVEAIAEERGKPLPPMQVGLNSWAMVMRDGDYAAPHDHAEAHWGAVYYADAGDTDDAVHPESGRLVFVDPRHGVRQMPGLAFPGETFSVTPRTGRLVVFPAWLLHFVHPYRGQRPRVAIACNLLFHPASPPP